MLRKTVLGTMLLMSIAVIFVIAVQPSHAQGMTVGVTPATATVGIGKEIVINITLTNVAAPGIFSYQLKLTYDNTLLNATKAEIPPDHLLKPSSPSNIFVVDPGTADQANGFVTFAVTLLGSEPGKTGSGTLASVHFQGLAEGQSSLHLEVTLVDPNASEIPASSYTIEHGTLKVEAAPTTPGDVNGDTKIDIQDLVLAAKSFGSKLGDSRFDPAADQNKDGAITITDFVLIAMYWNQSLKK